MRLSPLNKMNYKSYIAIECFILLFVTMHSQFADGQEEEEETTDCDIKPGGSRLFCEKELDDVVCRFWYIAQGGTNEEWKLKMSHNLDQTKYTCTVERPSGSSYLFFQEFHLEMEGVNVESAEVYANHVDIAYPHGLSQLDLPKNQETPRQGPNMKHLPAAEYKIDHKTNSVSDVQGKFANALDKVSLIAVRPKEEL